MFNFRNLDEHMDSDEKVILFFRPSRKAYLFQYVLMVLLMLLCLGLLTGSLFTDLGALLRWSALLIFVFLCILLIRVEYRIWSRKYALTTERIMYSRGILSETFMSANYAYITDIRFHQSFWDKLMNTGTLSIDTAGTDYLEIRYRKINNPLDVKKKIYDLQQAALKSQGVPARRVKPLKK